MSGDGEGAGLADHLLRATLDGEVLSLTAASPAPLLMVLAIPLVTGGVCGNGAVQLAGMSGHGASAGGVFCGLCLLVPYFVGIGAFLWFEILVRPLEVLLELGPHRLVVTEVSRGRRRRRTFALADVLDLDLDGRDLVIEGVAENARIRLPQCLPGVHDELVAWIHARRVAIRGSEREIPAELRRMLTE